VNHQQEPTLSELAEQLKRTRDSHEAMLIAAQIKQRAHEQAEELRKILEPARRTIVAEGGVTVESCVINGKVITNVMPLRTTFVAEGESGPCMDTRITDQDGDPIEQLARQHERVVNGIRDHGWHAHP
jgi:hypothetical protein